MPVWFTALFQAIVLLLEGFHEARPRLFLFACFWPVIMPLALSSMWYIVGGQISNNLQSE